MSHLIKISSRSTMLANSAIIVSGTYRVKRMYVCLESSSDIKRTFFSKYWMDGDDDCLWWHGKIWVKDLRIYMIHYMYCHFA